MPFFSTLLKNIRKFFRTKPVTKAELCKEYSPVPLVWNEDGVLLDTHSDSGDYVFHNFTGHLYCFKVDCEVRNATFVYHAGLMHLLAGIEPGPGMSSQIPRTCNHIRWSDGELLSGKLYCPKWTNGSVLNGELSCDSFETGIINGGKIYCSSWRGGTVNQGHFLCVEWLCGTFNGGTFRGTWRDGIFNGGTFRGEWYGGIWNGGVFQGKVLVGDGTFEWISKNQTKEE